MPIFTVPEIDGVLLIRTVPEMEGVPITVTAPEIEGEPLKVTGVSPTIEAPTCGVCVLPTTLEEAVKTEPYPSMN